MAPVPVLAEGSGLFCASETGLMRGGVRIDLHAQIVHYGSDFGLVHEPVTVSGQGLLHYVAKGWHWKWSRRLISLEPGWSGLNKIGDGEKNPMHVSAQELGHGVYPVVQRAVIEGNDHRRVGLRCLSLYDAVQIGQADGLKAEFFDEVEMAAKLLRRHAAVRPHLMVAKHWDACAEE